MIQISLTQEEYDTMYESILDYMLRCQEQIQALKGYQDKQNYWINENMLASELLEKIKELDNETNP